MSTKQKASNSEPCLTISSQKVRKLFRDSWELHRPTNPENILYRDSWGFARRALFVMRFTVFVETTREKTGSSTFSLVKQRLVFGLVFVILLRPTFLFVVVVLCDLFGRATVICVCKKAGRDSWESSRATWGHYLK